MSMLSHLKGMWAFLGRSLLGLSRGYVPPAEGQANGLKSQGLTTVFAVWVVVGFLLTAAYGVAVGGWHFTPPLLWALALLCVGTFGGFLFALPKTLQGAAAPQGVKPAGPMPTAGLAAGGTPAAGPAGIDFRVNTNLEEISDWLTKIIVGFGLIQLRALPDQLSRLGSRIGESLVGPEGAAAAGAHTSFGIAVVLFFVVAGFLFGYLYTRLNIQGALARSDIDLIAQASREATEQKRDVKLGVLQMPAPPPAAAERPSGIDNELRELARRYEAVNTPDYELRVREKNDAANEMGRHVLEKNIDRDALADEGGNAFVAALATASLTSPDPGDARRLLRAAKTATWKHALYRVVLAVQELHNRGLLQPADWQELVALLRTFPSSSDAPLARQVCLTIGQLGGSV